MKSRALTCQPSGVSFVAVNTRGVSWPGSQSSMATRGTASVLSLHESVSYCILPILEDTAMAYTVIQCKCLQGHRRACRCVSVVPWGDWEVCVPFQEHPPACVLEAHRAFQLCQCAFRLFIFCLRCSALCLIALLDLRLIYPLPDSKFSHGLCLISLQQLHTEMTGQTYCPCCVLAGLALQRMCLATNTEGDK